MINSTTKTKYNKLIKIIQQQGFNIIEQSCNTSTIRSVYFKSTSIEGVELLLYCHITLFINQDLIHITYIFENIKTGKKGLVTRVEDNISVKEFKKLLKQDITNKKYRFYDRLYK